MKKISLMLLCMVISVCTAQSQTQSKPPSAPSTSANDKENERVNSIILSLGIGADVPARGKGPTMFGYLELQRSWAWDKLSIGVTMSGKNNITKQIEANDSIVGGKYYLFGMSLGLKVSAKRSQTFNGTGFGGTVVTVWDNFKLNPEFPFGVGPYLQVVYNIKGKATGDNETTYGILFRSTYLIYRYQSTDPIDIQSKVTPGFQFRLGSVVKF